MEIVKLKPFLLEKIWGGAQLNDFGFKIKNDSKIGEAWIISAHDNGMSYLESGQFAGQSLKDVFNQHRELFNDYEGEFPLLVKIITPMDFLPVHLHPNDKDAQKYSSLGKPESWLVLSAPKDAYLIYGHNAQTKSELAAKIKQNDWMSLLKKVPINVGDFIYVPPGKIHAITPNVIVYEVQRSSDIAFRIYDFNRVDNNGLPRKLDIKNAIECILIPDDSGLIIKNAKNHIFSSAYFSVYLWKIKKHSILKISEKPNWWQFSVIEGCGIINGQNFQVGDSAISLGEIETVRATGNLKVIVSWIKS